MQGVQSANFNQFSQFHPSLLLFPLHELSALNLLTPLFLTFPFHDQVCKHAELLAII